jgi:hypothetical protein
MAFVVASSSRGSVSAPRKPAPNSRSKHHASPWRLLLNAITGGLWVVGAGVVSVMTVLLGTGWLLAMSTTARSAIQPVAAFSIPPNGGDWLAPATTTIAEKSQGAKKPTASAAVEDRFVFGTALPVKTVRVASIAPELPHVKTEKHVAAVATSSIGPTPAKVAATDIALPLRRPDAPPQVPLPRIKPKPAEPKLASLGPPPGIPKPAEEPHPPRTAVYDITAQLVYLPNGERLEAHSGLGEFMDEPSSSRIRMRGVTPPNTYTLKLRESLFHGVQALRMTPVDESRMFGRDGILAHTYMLGPQGASNGCVSFRDYPRFLRAYLRGEIERIVVVPRLGRPPTFASQVNTKA